MERCFLFLLVLVMGRYGFSQEEEKCPKTVINSCGDCITSGPYCVWCKHLNFTRQKAARCDTRAQLIAKGCPEAEIISPQNDFHVVRDVPLSQSFGQQESVQLQPQEINLKLRPGIPTTFTVFFKRVQGYPVDLYYLMDLSYSMEDDLRKIKSLGRDLFEALKKFTEHAQIGFGSFVDKTVLPFTNTNKEKLKKPCEEKETHCQPAFGYRHVLSMTGNAEEFNTEVGQQYISGNLDSPEGSLDAMMQAAVCGDKIGWRNSSTRLIVLTTDAGFHMAGDGKLAGILEPNDEECYMENNQYVRSSEMDYPSVGQVAMQFAKNNIQAIFAVTENVAQVYRDLSRVIPKSEVGVLSSDSKNVVDLIKHAYDSLSSKVTMRHKDLPENVRVTYTPICPNGGAAGAASGECDNVGVGVKIAFNITLTAYECMAETSFSIGPLGFKDKLKVTVSTQCECDCGDRGNSSSHCSDKGQVSCGMCSCEAGFVGQTCECSVGEKNEASLRASCQKDNGVECQGRGDCVCGRCQCHGSYHGDYCECDDEHCPKFQNQLCGGNGKCRCDVCDCKPGYTGPACRCTQSQEQCTPPGGSVCSGRGTCDCDLCECQKGYRRPYCDECIGCTSPCQTKQKCIECLGFNTGPYAKTCAEKCGSVRHTMVDELKITKVRCKQKDAMGCWMHFSMEQQDGPDLYNAEILKTRDCPELPNIYAIIGGSIAGVALIGILILLLIKALIHINDLKEFRKFENEKKKSKWAEADNPLFKNATTSVTNPTFTGE